MLQESSLNEKAQAASMRSNIYAFAARFYSKEPDAEFLQWLLDPNVKSILQEFNIHPEKLIPRKRTQKAILLDLAVEYTRLFIGPGKHIPPYESVHRGADEGSLLATNAHDVKQFLKTYGFDYASHYKDLPDHISIELEFMQHLTREEANNWKARNKKAARNCIKIQKLFLTEHLLTWAHHFFQKVMNETTLPFYHELTNLINNFLLTVRASQG